MERDSSSSFFVNNPYKSYIILKDPRPAGHSPLLGLLDPLLDISFSAKGNGRVLDLSQHHLETHASTK